MNDKAIGICVVGNFDQIEPNNKYLFALSSICRAYMRRFGIQVQNVNFHRDYANKSCPGLFFNKVKLRDYIENGIHTKRNYPDGNPTT
jgi:N-acetyl-anhydromuramyl-L-alanine amidase AmpD